MAEKNIGREIGNNDIKRRIYGNQLRTRTDILECIKRVYEDLYSEKVPQKPCDVKDKRAKLQRKRR